MNGIQRNARIGYLVWGGLAVLCLLVFMVAREQERAALTERVDAAERRALLYGDTVLHHALEARDVSTPLVGTTYRNLQAVIQDRVFDDPLVARVRLWSPDGTLLFSTAANERGKIGRLRVNEDPAITAAAGGAVTSRLATVPFTTSSGGEAAPTDLFETFVPLRVTDRTDVLGAVQIDRYFDAVRSAAAGPWRAVQWTCAGLAVVFGALALRSFRRRSEEPVVAAPASRPAAPPPVRMEEPAPRSGELEESVAALRAEHEESATALRAEHEETIAALRAEHEESVAALRAEREEAVAALEAELAATSAVASAAAAESDRLVEAERRVAEAEDRASEAERRATDLEAMLAAVRHEAQEAADEALAQPSAATSLEAQALELLEARVIDAEDRAADAERRLAELGFEGPPARSNGHRATPADADARAERYPEELEASDGDHADGDHADDGDPDGSPVFPISPEASEMRARLARSAALKKRSIEGS